MKIIYFHREGITMNSSTANKQKGIKLIPFTVNKVVEQVNEIPPGVQLIHAPQVWEKSAKRKRHCRCCFRYRL